MLRARRTGVGRGRSCSVGALLALCLAFVGSALLAAVSFASQAASFLSTPQPLSSLSPSSSSWRAEKHSRRAAPLFGIKRKVKAEMETNVSDDQSYRRVTLALK